MKNVILGMWAFLLTLVLPLPALAAGLNGAELSIGWVLPFAGILLCIAICPLAVPHFWHGNYGKVAVFWALATAVPLFVIYGGGVAAGSVAHALIGDYIPFIIFVACVVEATAATSANKARGELTNNNVIIKQIPQQECHLSGSIPTSNTLFFSIN